MKSKQKVSKYTAVIQKEGKWWIGWIEEIPGINGQGRTRASCVSSLKSALREALAMNRAAASSPAETPFEEVSIEV